MLTLPTTASAVFANAWRPAMDLLPTKMLARQANIIGIAIGGQETGYRTRAQMGGGPARSFWQFEMGGVELCTPNGRTCWGVLTHPETRGPLADVCAQLGIAFNREAIFGALATNDTLGAVMARLLLWTDPDPLPTDQAGAWEMYLRLWRPGKPDDARWPTAYGAAFHAIAD